MKNISQQNVTVSSGYGYFLYFSVFAVNIFTFAVGGCWSWTSPVLPKLHSLDPDINPLSKPTTTFEDSWIAAIMNLGAIAGPLVSGIFSERIGKKKTLLTLGFTVILSHLLSAFAVNVHFFLIGRFLIGIGAGTAFGIIPGYVRDIAEEKNRGILGSMLGVFNCLGILFMYAVGPYLSIRTFSIVNLLAPVMFYIIFGLFVPDSPYDLLKQGKQREAENSLLKLRGKKYLSDVQKEIQFIRDTLEISSVNDEPVRLFVLLKNKAVKKGMIISGGLMVFQQFSGICAVIGYMQTIFEMTGSSIPSIYLTMLIGVVQLLSNFVSSQLVEKAGRKCLLIISHIISMLSLIALGSYFLLASLEYNIDYISWFPVASVITYIIAFNLGLANMPWVILAEIFPTNAKAVCTTITTFFNFILSFIVTMLFPFASEILGLTGIFWSFATILFAGCIFCVLVVPETKGKTDLEIQNIIQGIKK